MIFLVNLDNLFSMVCMSFHKIVVCTRYVSNFFCPIVHFTYLVRPIILKKIIFPIKFKLDNLHAYPDFRKLTIFGKLNMNAYSSLPYLYSYNAAVVRASLLPAPRRVGRTQPTPGPHNRSLASPPRLSPPASSSPSRRRLARSPLARHAAPRCPSPRI